MKAKIQHWYASVTLAAFLAVAGSAAEAPNAGPKPLWEAINHSGVNWLAFSPNGRELAAASMFDPKSPVRFDVTVWQASRSGTGSSFATLPQRDFLTTAGLREVFALDYGSGDKSWKLAAADSFGSIVTWNRGALPEGSAPKEAVVEPDLKAKAPRVVFSALSMDPHKPGRFAAAEGKHVVLWEGKKPRTLGGQEGLILGLAFNPRAPGCLASASADSTIAVWKLDDPEANPQILKGHTAKVNSVAYSADGKALVSGSADGTVRLWDPQAGSVVKTFGVAGGPKVLVVAYSATGLIAAGLADGTVRIWDAGSGSARAEFMASKGFVSSLAFCPTEPDFLATAGNDPVVKLWSVKSLPTPENRPAVTTAPAPAPRIILFEGNGPIVVEIDGRLQGHADAKKPLTIRNLAPGSHEITLRPRTRGGNGFTVPITIATGEHLLIKAKDRRRE